MLEQAGAPTSTTRWFRVPVVSKRQVVTGINLVDSPSRPC